MKTNSPLLLPALAVVLTLLAALPGARGAAGDLDALDANVVGSYVLATAVQPDGKTIVAGLFTSVLGVPRSNIARLNADGTLDAGFDPEANGQVNGVAVQADGKIVLGGFFTSLRPNGGAATSRSYIARLNADGSVDPVFDPYANTYIHSVAVQADGKVLFGGNFTWIRPNGAPSLTYRNFIARVHADGSLDAGFDPKVNEMVLCVEVQADGKILLAGNFYTIQPNGAPSATSRSYIARVHADGSLDAGFDPKANTEVACVTVQADGKILLGGGFTTLEPNGAGATNRSYLARVNADGSLDTGFDPEANAHVRSLAVQADGKILCSGDFTTLQPNGAVSATNRNYIARVHADGTLDTAFDPKASGIVYGVAVQADGKVLLGGLFTTLQPNGAASPTTRNRFARLNNDAATQTLSAPDATQVLWQRGGAAPEMSRVTFEQSIDGGANWTALGNGTRVGTTANWQLTGLTLPASGQLRARGRITSGNFNNSAGLVETVVSFITVTLPDIAVEQPLATGLVDGASSIAFGPAPVGSSSAAKIFTIKNTGTADLTNLAISKDGANPGDFTVSAPVSTTVTPGNSTTFTVTFTAGGAVTATRAAAIHIASNVTGTKNPFDLALTGQALSYASDTDGDGLNDASEFQMAALGFEWQVSQPALVNTLTSSLNGAGYFTPSQVQALNVGVPLLQRNPATGVFTLTIGVRKTSHLSLPFTDFPMNGPGTSTAIDGAGKLLFQFTVPDNAAFFRLESQ